MRKFKIGDIIYQRSYKEGDRFKVVATDTSNYNDIPEVSIVMHKRADGRPEENKALGQFPESMFELAGPRRIVRNLPEWF